MLIVKDLYLNASSDSLWVAEECQLDRYIPILYEIFSCLDKEAADFLTISHTDVPKDPLPH